jgi:hypothetical protein
MILPFLTMDIEVINEDLQEGVPQTLEDFGHSSRKGTCGILESEWHDSPFEQPTFSN